MATPSDPTNDTTDDRLNYAILIALYTLQGIPMGLSASIPFLIQQKIQTLAKLPTFQHTSSASSLSYKANAIFSLCSWPFSLKLCWAPIVDACYFRRFGRRKSWLIPVQTIAGLTMVLGAGYVERQLSFGSGESAETFRVGGLTVFFLLLYTLMATQDIALDGWAITMLSKKNRGKGPVCNSIGQNIGYFLSFVGFLAFNDPESCNSLWRPLLRLPAVPDKGMVSLGGFISFMGYFMLVATTSVAVFKREIPRTLKPQGSSASITALLKRSESSKEEGELDASEIGVKETYRRLWSVCKLPAVRWLSLILMTYRLPTSLSDNVKFLKAVEYGLSKSVTALLSPTVILPLGILVPIVATKIFHDPMNQFMTGFKARVTLVPFCDLMMLYAIRNGHSGSRAATFWLAIVASTALQAVCNSMQFNAQMTFFAQRVDPAIAGSYMTLLNTVANLGSSWPASFVMWLMALLSEEPTCSIDPRSGSKLCTGGRDPYVFLQLLFCIIGCSWVALLGGRVRDLAEAEEDSWRTHAVASQHSFDEEALKQD